MPEDKTPRNPGLEASAPDSAQPGSHVELAEGGAEAEASFRHGELHGNISSEIDFLKDNKVSKTEFNAFAGTVNLDVSNLENKIDQLSINLTSQIKEMSIDFNSKLLNLGAKISNVRTELGAEISGIKVTLEQHGRELNRSHNFLIAIIVGVAMLFLGALFNDKISYFFSKGKEPVTISLPADDSARTERRVPAP
ncbi:MAG: hypothetical protein LBW85_11045 [Deltaproteobacteria bacterium]|nr:hypothetical protein [Deltaproteobacteria bacterium]